MWSSSKPARRPKADAGEGTAWCDVMNNFDDTAEDDSYWRDVIHGSKRKLIEWISEEPSDLLDELDCKELIHRDVYKQVKEISDFKKQSRFLLDHFIDSQEENCKNFLQSLRDVKNNYHPELQDWIENLGKMAAGGRVASLPESSTLVHQARVPQVPWRIQERPEDDPKPLASPEAGTCQAAGQVMVSSDFSVDQNPLRRRGH
ncbi:unnamed protein product [Lampetra planeri]